MIACPTCGRADHRPSPDSDLAHLYRHTSAKALAQARAEGERAGIEMAARHIDRRWLTNASQSETVLLKDVAAEVRALKIEVK